MTALALHDEHLPAGPVQITEAETEDFAAAETAEHHCFEHGPIPQHPTRAEQGVDLARFQHPGQRSRGANQRHPSPATIPGPPGRQTTRHRIPLHVTTDHQKRIQRRHRRQPALDRPSRQPRLPVRQPDHPRIPDRSLSSDELQHIRRRNLERVLGDDREEHLQIEPRRQHRVRTTPSISKRQRSHPPARDRAQIDPALRRGRTNQARGPGHTDILFRSRRDHHQQSLNAHPASTKEARDYPHILTFRVPDIAGQMATQRLAAVDTTVRGCACDFLSVRPSDSAGFSAHGFAIPER